LKAALVPSIDLANIGEFLADRSPLGYGAGALVGRNGKASRKRSVVVGELEVAREMIEYELTNCTKKIEMGETELVSWHKTLIQATGKVRGTLEQWGLYKVYVPPDGHVNTADKIHKMLERSRGKRYRQRRVDVKSRDGLRHSTILR
jgi:hypothetical protein